MEVPTQLPRLRRRQQKYQKALDIIEGRRRAMVSDIEKCKADTKLAAEIMNHCTEAIEFLEVVEGVCRDTVKVRIEDIITTALQTIYETDAIEFEIEFLTRRNQSEADFWLYTSDSNDVWQKGSLEDSYGGAYAEVVSIILRFMIMEMMNVPGPITGDEPGKFIDVSHSANFARFIGQLCKKLDRQAIIVTHNESLASEAHRRFLVTQTNGVSSIIVEE